MIVVFKNSLAEKWRPERRVNGNRINKEPSKIMSHYPQNKAVEVIDAQLVHVI